MSEVVVLAPEFNAEAHEYRVEGALIPSTTTIIKEAWPLETRWYHPSGTRRGSDVHAITAAMDRFWWGAEVPVGEPEYQPYVSAWLDYRDQTLEEFVWIEQRFAVPCMGYAGAVDRIARKKDGTTVLIDIKTGQAADWHELQQGSYALAARMAGIEVQATETVRLAPNGRAYAIPNDIERGIAAWTALMKWRAYRGGKK